MFQSVAKICIHTQFYSWRFLTVNPLQRHNLAQGECCSQGWAMHFWQRFYWIGRILITGCILITGFPHKLENLENNKFIFQVLEISLNLTESENVLKKVLPVKKSTYNKKKTGIDIISVEENFEC